MNEDRDTETLETGEKIEWTEQRGLTGNNYRRSLGVGDIAKTARKQLKKDFPNCKFSVTIQRYSMGQSIHISLMEGDFMAFKNQLNEMDIARFEPWIKDNRIDGLKYAKDNGHMQLNPHINHLRDEIYLTDECREVMVKAVELIQSFNYDNCDIMTDYFDVNFYLHPNIGKWNKPYVCTVPVWG